jgi:hypothetical protein
MGLILDTNALSAVAAGQTTAVSEMSRANRVADGERETWSPIISGALGRGFSQKVKLGPITNRPKVPNLPHPE